MSSKPDFSRKILRILSEKTAISLPELIEKAKSDLGSKSSKNPQKYAISRALKGLSEAGLVESVSSGQNDFARLTKSGRVKANSFKLKADSSVLDLRWDGKWRIVLLDLPESRKAERESLRYLLKKAGFVCLKNSAWISPYPFEFLFENIKKDLNLTTELMILVTSEIDEESRKEIFKMFGK
jgi:DNA-binding transcriptional regulator PaaX